MANFKRPTTVDLINNGKYASAATGIIIETLGYATKGDGGGALWKKTGVTGLTASQSPADMVDGKLTDANGHEWEIVSTVTFENLGADASGATDSAAALQAAFSSGRVLEQDGGTFRFDTTLTLPAGTSLYMRGGATLKKNFAGTGLRNTNWDTPANTDDGYILHGLRIRQTNVTDRGNVLELVNVSNVELHQLNIVQIATTDAQGAWSVYVSGDNIRITEPFIDSRVGTLFADGIHVAYAKNLSISDGIILAGDDAIALFPPNKNWVNAGKDQAGGNITINNMVLASTDANLIRIGASGNATESDDAPPNVVYDGIRISNIVDATETKTAGTVIRIADSRAVGDIVGQHDNIVIDGVVVRKVSSEGVVRIVGNPDVTSAANVAQKNFKRITLQSLSLDNTLNGASVSGGGVESLTIEDSSLRRSAVATFSAFDFDTIDFLKLKNSLLETGAAGTTGTGASFGLCLLTEIDNCDVQSGGEFRTLDFVSNATQNTSARFFGGYIRDAARGIDDTGGVGLTELEVRGTRFSTSVSDITAAALTASTLLVEKSGEIATSDGTTGGTGSAGAGNQFVELVIGGTTYKVLHDGTV